MPNWELMKRRFFRRKSLTDVAQQEQEHEHDPTDSDSNNSNSNSNYNNNNNNNIVLRRTLTAADLILYGVGSSVGAGIYVLVGLGAQVAGPAIACSFAACGAACILTSLCYAEFAARLHVTGSAFVYSYVAFGEGIAWLVGWNLTLGYGFTTSVVARAWADYVTHILLEAATAAQWTLALPGLNTFLQSLSSLPLFFAPNYTCSPLSVLLVWIGTLVLLRGAKDSSLFNNIMTVLNIVVLLLLIFTGMFSGSIDSDNWIPFAPHGFTGILQGAGLVFFAFIGFDMVASLSEEVVHPQRNMPIGIVGSLVVSTVLYVATALTVVGLAPIALLGVRVPVINALLVNACCTHQQQLQQQAQQTCLSACLAYTVHPWLAPIARIVGNGAILGLTASCFTSLMGQPRILFSLAREGLIPPSFAVINPKTQVPDASIRITGIVTACLACLAPMESLANLISLGTLTVFTLVNAGVLVLRLRQNIQYETSRPMESPGVIGPPHSPSVNTTIHTFRSTVSTGSAAALAATVATNATASSRSFGAAVAAAAAARTAHAAANHHLHDHDTHTLGLFPPRVVATQQLHHIHHHQHPQHQHHPQQQHHHSSQHSSDDSMTRIESRPLLYSLQQQQKRRHVRQQRRLVTRWILVFSFCTLAASMLLAHVDDATRRSSFFLNLTMWCCWGFVALSVYYIYSIPPSWAATATTTATTTATNMSSGVAAANIFSCPGVPLVPLTGIACNNFMMGSLPIQSWVLLALWMMAGAAIYLFYGMHHAALNQKEEIAAGTIQSGLRLGPVPHKHGHPEDETEQLLQRPTEGGHAWTLLHSDNNDADADAAAAAGSLSMPKATSRARLLQQEPPQNYGGAASSCPL